jgi:phosphonate degradation associated HDIG domain protein
MTVDEILAVYDTQGATAYFGEAVTVTQHSLQAAYFAQRDEAPDSLVIAALLHDIGHLIEPAPDDIADWKTDARHERTGSRWLARHFGPDVFEPVRLHVPAKRYLCAVEPDYFDALSPASVVTLGLQGGPMSQDEMAGFEAESYFRAAIALRRWDDQAKIADLPTPGLAHYRVLLARLAG